MKYRSIFLIATAAAMTCSVASAAPPKSAGSVPFTQSCIAGLTIDMSESCDIMELLAGEKVVIETITALCWHQTDDANDEFTKITNAYVQFKGTGDVYYHAAPILLQKSESGPAFTGGRVYYNGVTNGPFYAEAGGDNKIKFWAERISTPLSSGYAQCNISIQGQYQ